MERKGDGKGQKRKEKHTGHVHIRAPTPTHTNTYITSTAVTHRKTVHEIGTPQPTRGGGTDECGTGGGLRARRSLSRGQAGRPRRAPEAADGATLVRLDLALAAGCNRKNKSKERRKEEKKDGNNSERSLKY